MKVFIVILTLLYSTLCISQDIIVKINGDSISSNISEIGINEIKYYKVSKPYGPLYIIDKSEVSNIVFNDGEIEHFSSSYEKKEEIIEKELTIEEVKRIIIEIINAYGYTYERTLATVRNKKYFAEFVDNYLKLTPEGDRKFTVSSYYYDFTAKCDIHELSKRDNKFSIVNVGVPLYYKLKNGEMRKVKHKNFLDTKLVIKVEGVENGEKLREALINYNNFFKEK